MILHIDKSALLHKLEFIIKNHEIAVVETSNKLSVLKKSRSSNVHQDHKTDSTTGPFSKTADSN